MLRQNPFSLVQRGFGCRARPTEQHEIIGKADDPHPRFGHAVVQRIQKDIGQQR